MRAERIAVQLARQRCCVDGSASSSIQQTVRRDKSSSAAFICVPNTEGFFQTLSGKKKSAAHADSNPEPVLIHEIVGE